MQYQVSDKEWHTLLEWTKLQEELNQNLHTRINLLVEEMTILKERLTKLELK